MAVREGFEPSIHLRVYTLSRRAPSATQTPHRTLRRYALQRGGTIGTGGVMVKQYLSVAIHLVIPHPDRVNRKQITWRNAIIGRAKKEIKKTAIESQIWGETPDLLQLPLDFTAAVPRFALQRRNMAVREGFEPSIRLRVYTLSRRAPSATQTPHRIDYNQPR